MGGIDNSSKPGSPVPGRGSLKDALRRGSQAMGLQDEQNQKIDVPQGQCHFLHITFSEIAKLKPKSMKIHICL